MFHSDRSAASEFPKITKRRKITASSILFAKSPHALNRCVHGTNFVYRKLKKRENNNNGIANEYKYSTSCVSTLFLFPIKILSDLKNPKIFLFRTLYSSAAGHCHTLTELHRSIADPNQ